MRATRETKALKKKLKYFLSAIDFDIKNSLTFDFCNSYKKKYTTLRIGATKNAVLEIRPAGLAIRGMRPPHTVTSPARNGGALASAGQGHPLSAITG